MARIFSQVIAEIDIFYNKCFAPDYRR